jgi:hypothetical protein
MCVRCGWTDLRHLVSAQPHDRAGYPVGDPIKATITCPSCGHQAVAVTRRERIYSELLAVARASDLDAEALRALGEAIASGATADGLSAAVPESASLVAAAIRVGKDNWQFLLTTLISILSLYVAIHSDSQQAPVQPAPNVTVVNRTSELSNLDLVEIERRMRTSMLTQHPQGHAP